MDTNRPNVVLLVEDDPNIQEIYATILKSGGYNVTSVISGDEALKEIEKGEAAFVLLDLMIPGIPGIEVLKKLRSDPKYKALSKIPRIVVVTNVADPKMRAEANELGVDKYVIKAEVSASQLPEILKQLEAGSNGAAQPAS